VATQIVQKLIEKDHVPIIAGVIGSNVMMAVQRPITEKEVVLIGANAGPSAIAGAQCSPYQFIVSWQNDGHAEAAGQVRHRPGYKRMVLISPNYQAGKDALQGFKRFYKGTVVDEIYPGMTQPDYSAEISPRSPRPSRMPCTRFSPARWVSTSSASTSRPVSPRPCRC
jgi:branched-chain amino acid transport system substrate-binding protein